MFEHWNENMFLIVCVCVCECMSVHFLMNVSVVSVHPCMGVLLWIDEFAQNRRLLKCECIFKYARSFSK